MMEPLFAESDSFWSHLPAILTALAALIAAWRSNTAANRSGQALSQSAANSEDLKTVKTDAKEAKVEAAAAKVETTSMRSDLKEIHHATNSMAAELNKVTGQAEHAKGVIEGELRRNSGMGEALAIPAAPVVIENVTVEKMNVGEKKLTAHDEENGHARPPTAGGEI